MGGGSSRQQSSRYTNPPPNAIATFAIVGSPVRNYDFDSKTPFLLISINSLLCMPQLKLSMIRI
jgi:hypothetical protein